jgi:hypothetical protein
VGLLQLQKRSNLLQICYGKTKILGVGGEYLKLGSEDLFPMRRGQILLPRDGRSAAYFGGRFLWGCIAKRAAGDLGGIEETRADVFPDRFDQHAVGHASDEVADVVCAGERGKALRKAWWAALLALYVS